MVCAGIACSVSGAAVAGVMNSKTGNKENPVLGNIFFGLQCFFGSMFFLLQKSFLNRYPPLQTTAWGALHHAPPYSDDALAVPLTYASTCALGYCMGGILMVLVVTPQATEASDWDIDRNELLAILYVIFISSALGYALYACEQVQYLLVLCTSIRCLRWPEHSAISSVLILCLPPHSRLFRGE